MRVTVIGAGYVGLTTAACLAKLGHSVTCIERRKDRLTLLGAGKATFHETGLEALLQAGLTSGRLRFSSTLTTAGPLTDLLILAVGTPPAEDGSADLGALRLAAINVAPLLPVACPVMIRSTVPPGTAAMIEATLEESGQIDPRVISCPEFLREGTAVRNFFDPTRIVIGARHGDALRKARHLFGPLNLPDERYIACTPQEAEMIKYASNVLLASRVALWNEIARICDAKGANVLNVALGVAADPAIGSYGLEAGPGFGGSCFPKDVDAFIAMATAEGEPLPLAVAINDSNLTHQARMVAKVLDACGGSVVGAELGVLGLAYKAGTDDIRESPAVAIIERLANHGATFRVFDPAVGPEAASGDSLLEECRWCDTAEEVAQNADALLILTEWEEFARLDLEDVFHRMKHARIIDLRNVFRGGEARRAGFEYYGLGREG